MQREVLEAHEAATEAASTDKYRSLQSLAFIISRTPARCEEAKDLMLTALDGLNRTLGPENTKTRR